MTAFTLVLDDGRVLRLEQNGVDVQLVIDREVYPLSRRDRLDLAKYLLSGVTTLENVVERLANNQHVFEDLPEVRTIEAPRQKAPQVTEEHRFSRASKRVVVVDEEEAPAGVAAQMPPPESGHESTA